MSLPFFNKFPYTNLNDINLDWIIKKVKELTEQFTSQAQDISYAVLTANHADATATSARNAATNAQTAATVALERANSVQGIAESAVSTAQAAVTTAQAAETTANAIAGTANNALTVAQAAESTAAAAEQAAQDAVDSAQDANTAAGTAIATANNAAQSAQTAINTANAAMTIASSAGGLNFTDTASGDIATFPDGMALPAINITTTITPSQAGTGEPAPTNVRAISGYTQANIIVSPTTDIQDGTIYNVRFTDAGIVYGGTLDVTAGTLTITKLCKTLTGTETWTLQAQAAANPRRFTKAVTSLDWETPVSNSAISSHFVLGFPNSSTPFGAFRLTSTYLMFADSGSTPVFSSANEFKAWVKSQYDNGTPVQVCYDIATPQTYTLTPTEVQLLMGTNNVWADTNGTTTVEYHADPQKWIEKKLSE